MLKLSTVTKTPNFFFVSISGLTTIPNQLKESCEKEEVWGVPGRHAAW
jgi:hypothetical protein